MRLAAWRDSRLRPPRLDCGPAGVGKTLSARRYANWDMAEPLIEGWGPRTPADAAVNAALARSRAVFHTPPVLGTLRSLRDALDEHMVRVGMCIEEHADADGARRGVRDSRRLVELLIIDESERLPTKAIELIRDEDQSLFTSPSGRRQ